MTKIAYNTCFGGFSISDKAIHRYAEIKGITLYPETTQYGSIIYFTVPEDQRPAELNWPMATLEERKAYNEAYKSIVIYGREFDRTDPVLIQVIEELGPKANGQYARLDIRDVPEGTQYRIDEYDGSESVMTPEDYEWEIA